MLLYLSPSKRKFFILLVRWLVYLPANKLTQKVIFEIFGRGGLAFIQWDKKEQLDFGVIGGVSLFLTCLLAVCEIAVLY